MVTVQRPGFWVSVIPDLFLGPSGTRPIRVGRSVRVCREFVVCSSHPVWSAKMIRGTTMISGVAKRIGS